MYKAQIKKIEALDDKAMRKLAKSALAKCPQSPDTEMSINERVKKIFNKVMLSQKFWSLASRLEKPIKSNIPSEARSTDILSPAQNAPDK